MHNTVNQSQIQGFYSIIDRYLKSNDVGPLNAYLKHIETGDTNESLFKQSKSTLYSNFVDQHLILAQKTYKFILCIDFSELSSLDLIGKAIDTFFDSLSSEYNEFVGLCTSYAPKIYLTVLLWHPAYFKNVKKSFTVLLHSKYLLRKFEFAAYSAQIYDKILEFKSSLVKLKQNEDEIGNWLVSNEAILLNSDCLLKYFLNYDQYNYYQHPHHRFHPHHHQPPPAHPQNLQSSQTMATSRTCSFDSLLFYIDKISKFFSNQDYCNLNVVYITNGLVHTTDVMKQLEVLFRSNATLSFICLASTGCSFGYSADCTFMRFLARITRGYYAYVNDYLEYEIVENNRLLLAFKHDEAFLADDYQTNEVVYSAEDLNTDLLIHQSNAMCVSVQVLGFSKRSHITLTSEVINFLYRIIKARSSSLLNAKYSDSTSQKKNLHNKRIGYFGRIGSVNALPEIVFDAKNKSKRLLDRL
jgi:hypothetical protein